MAGSYNHAVNNNGLLRRDQSIAAENLGDASETIEEMFGMIWWLASGSEDRVELARQNYRQGLAMSPGVEVVDE